MDLNAVVSGVVLERTCSIRPHAESDERKTVTLRITYDGVPLQAVFDRSASWAAISWQNGPGRKIFDTLSNGQVVEVNFKAPGRTQVDPEAAVIARARALPTREEREKYIRELLGQVG